MESLSPILFLSKKHHSSNDILNALSNLPKQHNWSTIKIRMAIIAQISQFYLKLVISFGVKLNAFNSSLFNNKNGIKNRRQTTTRKKREEKTMKKKGIYNMQDNTVIKQNKTLEKMLEQELASMRNSQTILNGHNQFLTIKKQQQDSQDILSSASHQKRMIWQSMNQNIPIEMDLKQMMSRDNFKIPEQNQIINIGHTQIELQKYKNLLEIQKPKQKENIAINNPQRTRKKARHQPKKKQIDAKINVTQGDTKLDDNVMAILTKTKQKKAFYHSIFETFNKIETRNRILQNQQQFINVQENKSKMLKLQEQILQIEHIRHETSQFHNQYFNYEGIKNDFDSQSSQETNSQYFLCSLEKHNEKIKEKIQNIISTKLEYGPLQLNAFMHQKNLKRTSKALLFYQLLSMNFDMMQENPQKFGQIVITKDSQQN